MVGVLGECQSVGDLETVAVDSYQSPASLDLPAPVKTPVKLSVTMSVKLSVTMSVKISVKIFSHFCKCAYSVKVNLFKCMAATLEWRQFICNANGTISD